MPRVVPVLLALAVLLVAAPSASAGIWTPVASGTTSEIRAIDYQAADRLWYATANGRLAYRLADGTFAQGTGPGPGVVFNDIAFQPGTQIGIAVGNTDNVWRSTNGGVSWTRLDPKTNSNDECANVGGALVEDPGDLFSVGWGAGGVVYLGGDKKTVLRSQDAGATFAEVNKTGTGCRLGQAGSTTEINVSDLQVIDSSSGRANELVYFQGRSAFGPFYVTGDGLQSEAASRSGGPNGTEVNTNFAADPVSPNRVWSTNQCGFSCFVRSSDGMASEECVCTPVNQNSGQTQSDHHDVAFAGGTVLAVGDAGMIEQSVDGTSFFYNPADAPNALRPWRSVDLFDGSNAAVGGADGTLVLTTQAATVPDVVDPTGTVSGPTTVVAGQPATFTAGVADDAGGSGIDPASFAWTAVGTPGGAGNPITLTFPSPGSTTVRVAFEDRAGNEGTASLGVLVRAATTATAPPPGPAGPTPRPPSATLTKTAALAGGGSIALGVPRACIPVGSTFTARLSFKRSTRRGARAIKVSRVDFTVDGKGRTIDRRAPFTKRISVRALKAGTRHTLRARATIKVRRGKSPKKSISTTFRVCG